MTGFCNKVLWRCFMTSGHWSPSDTVFCASTTVPGSLCSSISIIHPRFSTILVNPIVLLVRMWSPIVPSVPIIHRRFSTILVHPIVFQVPRWSTIFVIPIVPLVPIISPVVPLFWKTTLKFWPAPLASLASPFASLAPALFLVFNGNWKL